MTCAPSTGWSSDNSLRRESAGGQLEQPSEVKSSTRTGRPEEGLEVLASGRDGAERPTRVKARAETRAKRPAPTANARRCITCPNHIRVGEREKVTNSEPLREEALRVEPRWDPAGSFPSRRVGPLHFATIPPLRGPARQRAARRKKPGHCGWDGRAAVCGKVRRGRVRFRRRSTSTMIRRARENA